MQFTSLVAFVLAAVRVAPGLAAPIPTTDALIQSATLLAGTAPLVNKLQLDFTIQDGLVADLAAATTPDGLTQAQQLLAAQQQTIAQDQYAIYAQQQAVSQAQALATAQMLSIAQQESYIAGVTANLLAGQIDLAGQQGSIQDMEEFIANAQSVTAGTQAETAYRQQEVDSQQSATASEQSQTAAYQSATAYKQSATAAEQQNVGYQQSATALKQSQTAAYQGATAYKQSQTAAQQQAVGYEQGQVESAQSETALEQGETAVEQNFEQGVEDSRVLEEKRQYIEEVIAPAPVVVASAAPVISDTTFLLPTLNTLASQLEQQTAVLAMLMKTIGETSSAASDLAATQPAVEGESSEAQGESASEESETTETYN